MTTCLGKSWSFGLLTCLSWALVKFCVCPSFPFGIEGGMCDVSVLIPDHCLSIYFSRHIVFLFEMNFQRSFEDSENYQIFYKASLTSLDLLSGWST